MNNSGLELGSLNSSIGLGGKIIADDPNLISKQHAIYEYALNSGKCQLFDTSPAYGLNEEILGQELTNYGKRESIQIITKITNKQQIGGEIQKSLEESLKKLGTDYVDILLMHWPVPGKINYTWHEMEYIYEGGLAKNIGVCNFQRHHFEELFLTANIKPHFHEFEIHPLFTQDATINYCYYHEIRVIAYSPLGRMHDVLVKSKPVRTLAKKYKKSEAQIILRWHMQQNRIAIPSTLSKEHFDEMVDIFDYELSEREVAWISSLDDGIRLRYNSDICDFEYL